MTRPRRANWAERKHICRFDIGKVEAISYVASVFSVREKVLLITNLRKGGNEMFGKWIFF